MDPTIVALPGLTNAGRYSGSGGAPGAAGTAWRSNVLAGQLVDALEAVEQSLSQSVNSGAVPGAAAPAWPAQTALIANPQLENSLARLLQTLGALNPQTALQMRLHQADLEVLLNHQWQAIPAELTQNVPALQRELLAHGQVADTMRSGIDAVARGGVNDRASAAMSDPAVVVELHAPGLIAAQTGLESAARALAWPGQMADLHLVRERPPRGPYQPDDHAAPRWAVTLQLELPEHGALAIRVSLVGHTVALALRADRPEAWQSGLNDLADRLAARGLDAVSIALTVHEPVALSAPGTASIQTDMTMPASERLDRAVVR